MEQENNVHLFKSLSSIDDPSQINHDSDSRESLLVYYEWKLQMITDSRLTIHTACTPYSSNVLNNEKTFISWHSYTDF